MWACKVVKNKDPFFDRRQEHGSLSGKVVQYDQSDNSSHTTYFFDNRSL